MTIAASAQYTPGPWAVGAVDPHDIYAPSGFVARAYRTVSGPGDTVANAHLIAAAPDLAEALLDLAEVVNEIATEQCEAGINVEYWNRTSGEGWQAARAAEAALTKAGVQP